MLEIYFFGCDYGESTVVVYREGDDKICGVVDCFFRGPTYRENPIVRFIKEDLEIDELAFLIATHPHDDHIRGVSQLIHAFRTIEFIGWWGGISPVYQLAYLLGMQRNYREHARRLNMSFNSLKEIFDGIMEYGLRAWDTSDGIPSPFYEIMDRRGNRISSIFSVSPWIPEQSKYISKITSSVESDGQIVAHRKGANATSVGILIEYGSARILLGGDVERRNWMCACTRGILSEKKQIDVVKVPHHGSSSSVYEGMWSGRRSIVKGGLDKTIAIVTKYRLGGKKLPEDTVLEKIRNAGCRVFVVNGKSDFVKDRGDGDIKNLSKVSRFCVRLKRNREKEVISSEYDLELI